MASATTPVSIRREPDLLGQIVVVIGGSAGIGLEMDSAQVRQAISEHVVLALEVAHNAAGRCEPLHEAHGERRRLVGSVHHDEVTSPVGSIVVEVAEIVQIDYSEIVAILDEVELVVSIVHRRSTPAIGHATCSYPKRDLGQRRTRRARSKSVSSAEATSVIIARLAS